MKKGLTRGETEWLRCFINKIKYKNINSGYLLKNRIRKKIKTLLENIDLFSLEEIGLMIRASENPEMKITIQDREKLLDKISISLSKSFRQFPPLDKLKILKNTKKKIINDRKIDRLISKNIKIYDILSERLEKMNTHPGIIFAEDFDLVFNELKIDSTDIDIEEKNKSFDVRKPTIFDKLREVPNKELQFALNEVIFGNGLSNYIYWSIRKEHLDIEYLKKHNKHALKILERVKKYFSKNWTRRLRKGIGPTISKLYSLGLINQKRLEKTIIIKLFKENTLKLVKECNKINTKNKKIICQCVNNKIFTMPKNIDYNELQLTEYGEELLNKFKS